MRFSLLIALLSALYTVAAIPFHGGARRNMEPRNYVWYQNTTTPALPSGTGSLSARHIAQPPHHQLPSMALEAPHHTAPATGYLPTRTATVAKRSFGPGYRYLNGTASGPLTSISQ